MLTPAHKATKQRPSSTNKKQKSFSTPRQSQSKSRSRSASLRSRSKSTLKTMSKPKPTRNQSRSQSKKKTAQKANLNRKNVPETIRGKCPRFGSSLITKRKLRYGPHQVWDSFVASTEPRGYNWELVADSVFGIRFIFIL